MKIYISGAIHLQPAAGERFFREYEKFVTTRGHIAVVPHDIKAYHPNPRKDCPPSYSEQRGHTAACWLRGDFIELLKCDALLMIGTWENSVGAQREHSLACWSGIPIFYSVDTIPNREGYGF